MRIYIEGKKERYHKKHRSIYVREKKQKKRKETVYKTFGWAIDDGPDTEERVS